MAVGGDAEKLIADHWSKEIAAPQEPVRHEESAAAQPMAARPAVRPAVKIEAKRSAPARKKPAAKAPAKKAARRAGK